MGTNYYTEQHGEELHIGKMSGGWEFMLYAPEEGPQSWKEWKEFLRGRPIEDEYGKSISLPEFISRVESSRRPGARNHTAYCLKQYPHDTTSQGYDPEGWSITFREFS